MKKRWQWLIVVIGLVIAARQSLAVWRLWKVGEQVQTAIGDLQQEEQKNRDLEKKLAEVDSPDFIEKEARDKLGYSREGETVVIVTSPDQQITTQKSPPKPSWQQWWNLYIRI